jgi:crotonobetainyl-CoA:carnitine CoA-transferase CaiB-like acyl-CoA transferase
MVEMPGMLAGLRILDLTTGSALLCGRLLVDLGADVIVVELPNRDGPITHAGYRLGDLGDVYIASLGPGRSGGDRPR